MFLVVKENVPQCNGVAHFVFKIDALPCRSYIKLMAPQSFSKHLSHKFGIHHDNFAKFVSIALSHFAFILFLQYFLEISFLQCFHYNLVFFYPKGKMQQKLLAAKTTYSQYLCRINSLLVLLFSWDSVEEKDRISPDLFLQNRKGLYEIILGSQKLCELRPLLICTHSLLLYCFCLYTKC